MQSLQETLAAWTSILGIILTAIGLIQSRAWLTTVSALCVLGALAIGLYARKQRLSLEAAAVQIEGRSIDSLNIANLRRRMNHTLVIQEVQHEARIEGENLSITWQYVGYCRAEQETAIEFSVDSDTRISFDTLNCFAYDLGRDPGQKHKIQPVLIGADGISKKIAVPFLEPIHAQEHFSVVLKCELPGCIKPGFAYYTSTLSFQQQQVPKCCVRLLFIGKRPVWVRVYQYAPGRETTLLKQLRPSCENDEFTEYIDVEDSIAGQSARIYAFWRETDRSSTTILLPEEC